MRCRDGRLRTARRATFAMMPSCPAAIASLEELRARHGDPRRPMRSHRTSGDDLFEHRESDALWFRRQRLAVDVQAIEEERRQRQFRAQAIDIEAPAEPPHRFLKWQRRRRQACSASTSPSRISSRAGSCRTDSTTSGTADVTSRSDAREYPDIVARLVHLDACPVELELERRLTERRQRLGDEFRRSTRASARRA